jgi:hypothetical protein
MLTGKYILTYLLGACMFSRRVISAGIGFCAAALAGAATAEAATVYNAVNDFSSSNGGSSVWSYAYNVSDPLGTPTVLDEYITPFSGLTAWHNIGGTCCGGGSKNNSVLIGKNTTSGPISYNTIIQPNTYLEQDPESNASVDLIFTAQKAGTYNVSFSFLGIDTDAGFRSAGHAVDVLKNGTAVLGLGYIAGYGSAYDGALSVFLAAGDTVDFQTLTSPVTYAYLSTGVKAEVSLGVGTVPLPPAAPMLGAALVVLGGLGYGLKRKKAAAWSPDRDRLSPRYN